MPSCFYFCSFCTLLFNTEKCQHSFYFEGIFFGFRKKSRRKKNPDPKPNPISSLTLALPLTPHGRNFFQGDFFLAPAFFSYSKHDSTIKR